MLQNPTPRNQFNLKMFSTKIHMQQQMNRQNSSVPKYSTYKKHSNFKKHSTYETFNT